MADSSDKIVSPEDVRKALRRRSRRGFAVAGLGAAAAVGGLRWLATAADADGIPWPLRRMLRANESLGRTLFSPDGLAPTFDPAWAAEPRVNGRYGLRDDGTGDDPATWRLRVVGAAGDPAAVDWTLAQVRDLPRVEHTTELKCIEGWSQVVTWAGAPFRELAARTGLGSLAGRPYPVDKPPADLLPYVSLETPDGGYYVGLDRAAALHPQTLLCYEMNGESLTGGHGAPLRLVVPVKYGIKNIKRIGVVRFTTDRPKDFWAERGYDWYAGL
ncbi:MAG: molybdopterin-dependent oxidoreductase [Planctomycetia bacterium]